MNIKYIDMSQPINDQYRLASSDSFLFHKLLFGIFNRKKKRKKDGTSSQEWEREESKNVSAFVTDIFIRLFFICHRQFLLLLLHFWNLHLPAGGENNQISLLGKNIDAVFLVADFLSIKIKRLSKMLNVKMKNYNLVTILTCFKLSLLEVWCHHRDRSIHIGKACKLHHAKMTRQGLLHNGFNISLLSLLDVYIINFCSQ